MPLRQKKVEVPLAEQFELAEVDQAVTTILADRLQHPETGRAIHVEPRDNRLRDQSVDEVENIRTVQVVVRAHPLGRVQAEAVGEDRKSRPQALLVGVAEIVAPCDQRAQGLALAGVELEDGPAKADAFKLVDALEDCDDVQNVYANFDVSDEVLAAVDA